MEEEFEDSSRKNTPISRKRSFIKTDDESFFPTTARTNGIDAIPKFNSLDDSLFKRRSRSNSLLNTTDEIEYETQNLALKHTLSSDSLVSRGSRNFSRHSPLGSFRSIRNSTRRESDRNGINMVMVIGFSMVIAFGYVFNKIEIFLKWFQLILNELKLHLFGGKSIREFYRQETSMAKKCLYSPISGLYYVLQMLIYVFLKTFEILKKPAPKALVKNVFSRYIKD
ncbi:uncharacterized protein LOC129916597 [Episyrphus balteatus]|uniref:uncharacterized protein LOC129916597 n=1 Tax=Episyrphus balteatus TaxID=286459 RepID=UPI00248621F6|nr:uncharacterized protein LOC129916597 [Episyrphus balteatus]